MKQPTLPNRKRPRFRICPLCQVEFCLRSEEQRTCSQHAKHRAGGAPPKQVMPFAMTPEEHRRVGDLADAMMQEFKRVIAEKAKEQKP